MKSRFNVSGYTLIETMLAMVIAGYILSLGIRQYQSMKFDADVNQLKYNVDQVFEAAAEYYSANCKRQMSAVSGPVAGTGTLDPANTPLSPYVVTLTSLRTDGYMTAALPRSNIINNNGYQNGYIVQYNLVNPPPDRTAINSDGTTSNLGKIMIWRAQVAVELRETAKATMYKNLTGADCVSTIDVSYVTPCSELSSTPTSPPLYLVWERLPSFAVPEANSNLWTTNATNKQFNQLYETYPVIYLKSVPPDQYPQQYYLCGS